MGAATIISDEGAGRYTVKIAYTGLDGAIAAMQARCIKLDSDLSQLRTAANEAQAAVDQAQTATDALVADWIAGIALPDAPSVELMSNAATEYAQYASSAAAATQLPEAINQALVDLSRKKIQAVIVDKDLEKKQAEYLSAITRKAELNRLKAQADTVMTAWCADYVTNLTGTVATLDVPGEVNPLIGGGLNIAPAYRTRAAWSAAYGKIQYGSVMSETGFAWNLTMLQPWLKWMPRWRYATITSKNNAANTVDVTLAPIVSKARAWVGRQSDFNAPWESSMTDVPVDYMTCGARVFEIGDEVIVEFRGGGGGGLEYYEPYVIGFKQEPKMCEPLFFSSDYNETYEAAITDSDITWVRNYRYRGRSISIVPTQDDGVIISRGRRMTRYDRNAAVVWEKLHDWPSDVMNCDAFNQRLVTSNWQNGQARFYDPTTGAEISSLQLSTPATESGLETPYLRGAAVDSETGQMVYAQGNVSAPNTIHIGGIVVNLLSVYPPAVPGAYEDPYIQGLSCTRDYVFVLIFDPAGSRKPKHVLQLSKTGQLISVSQTPDAGSESPVWNGEVISGGGVAPAMPPPEE